MTEEFTKAFSTYMMPVAQKAATDGLLNDMTLARKALPLGTKTGPGFIEIRTYSKWENIEKFNPFALMSKVHPDVNFEEMGAKFEGKIDMTHTEVYELIGVITPETVAAASKTK